MSKVLVRPENYGILNTFLGLLFIVGAAAFFTFAHRASIHELTGTIKDIETTCSTRACVYEFSASQALWSGASFQDMAKRHMMMIMKYPHAPIARGIPYGGIENLRPESKRAVQIFSAWQPPRK